MRCTLETIRVGCLKNPEEVIIMLKEILLLLILETELKDNLTVNKELPTTTLKN